MRRISMVSWLRILMHIDNTSRSEISDFTDFIKEKQPNFHLLYACSPAASIVT